MIVADNRPQSIVGAQGIGPRSLRPLYRELAPLGRARTERPEFSGADAHFLEPMNSAAQAGAVVVLARPFIVSPGHFVQHPLTDLQGYMAAPVYQVDGRSQGKTRASTLAPLVQYVHIRIRWALGVQLYQRRPVNPVSCVGIICLHIGFSRSHTVIP